MTDRSVAASRALLVAWLVVVAWTTLRPAPSQAAAVADLHWHCVLCGDSGGADFLLNVLLYAPLGLALRGMRWPLWRTVTLLAALSISVELVQGAWLVVLANTTGAVTGWTAFGLVAVFARPSPSAARRGLAAILATMALLWWATAAALRPELSGPAPWWGQPLHVFPGDVPFPGTMQRATIDGIDIPNDRIETIPPWRDSISVVIDATRNTAERFARGIALLHVVDSAGDVQLAVSQDGDDARLRLRLRGSDWRLHPPSWRIADGLRMAAGVPWRFAARWRRNAITIESDPVNSPPRETRLPLSLGEGWVFIHPFVATIDNRAPIWTALWLGFWFGLAGWLAGWITIAEILAAALLALAPFVAISTGSGLQLRPEEVATSAASFALFTLLARRRRRRVATW